MWRFTWSKLWRMEGKRGSQRQAYNGRSCRSEKIRPQNGLSESRVTVLLLWMKGGSIGCLGVVDVNGYTEQVVLGDKSRKKRASRRRNDGQFRVARSRYVARASRQRVKPSAHLMTPRRKSMRTLWLGEYSGGEESPRALEADDFAAP